MGRLSLEFLGTFQVHLDARPLTRFRSANVQGLLVYLALQASRSFPRDVIATLFWPDEPDKVARTNLRQTLYQLRKLLKDKEQERPFLLVSRQTLQFSPDSDYVLDVRQFVDALNRDELTEAVALYRGDLLPGFATDSLEFEDWLRQERQHLHRLALNALHDLTAKQLGRGREALPVAQKMARRQLALEPWREVAHRQLMQALALSGDRAAALAQYESCAEILAEELGVPPSPETTALYEAIRDGTFAPELPPSPAEETPRAIAHNLPRQMTFLGRDAELKTLVDALTDPAISLLTVSGPGGAGKTTLALAAARQLLELANGDDTFPFSHGLFFVSLAPLSTVEDIPGAIADALDYRLPGDKPAEDELVEYLRHKSLLLVLDNFEHLANGTELVEQLLAAAPGLKACVTSRQRLQLRRETTLPVGGFDLPEDATHGFQNGAVQLFRHSARKVRLDYDLPPADLPHVVHICRLVGGMPLAIELAAGWVDTIPPAQIAQEIRRDLDFLATEQGGVPARQRSMRATFAHTWQLLTPAEQAALARLSVFRGGFKREAARALLELPLRTLARLVSKSLLQYDLDADRYHMHQLLRQFAVEKLAEAGALDDAHKQHSRYYLQLLIDREPDMKGRAQKEGLAAITEDLENVRAGWRRAVDRRDIAVLAECLSAFHLYGNLSGRLRQRDGAYRYALQHLPVSAGPSTAYLRDRILNRLNISAGERPDFQPQQVGRLLALFRERGDLLEIRLALASVNAQLLQERDFAQALQVVKEQSALMRRLEDPYHLSAQLIRNGFSLLMVGEFDAAHARIHEGLEIARAIGNLHGVAHASILLAGHATLVSGEYEAGEAYAWETASLSRELRLSLLVPALALWALHALIQGEFEMCEARCRRVLEQATRDNAYLDRAYYCSGLLLAAQGRYEAAQEHLERVPTLTTNPTVLHVTHFGLALVAFGRGNLLRAARELLDGLKLVPFPREVPTTFIWFSPVVAGILAAEGSEETALELLGLGRAHPACPHGLWERWALPDELEARLERRLPQAVYTAAKARGRALDLHETARSIHSELQVLVGGT